MSSYLDFPQASSSSSSSFRTLLRGLLFSGSDAQSILPTVRRARQRFLQCISYKLAILAYQAINGTEPGCLQSCFTRLVDVTCRQRLQYRPNMLPVIWQCRQFVCRSAAAGELLQFPTATFHAGCHICTITRGFQTAS